MRVGMHALALALLLGLAHATAAETSANANYKGIWVSTPYPSFDAGAGETVTLDLTVHNAGRPPQRVALAVDPVPQGWSAVFLGEGKRVQSVFVAPGDKATVKLRLEPSGDVTDGAHRFDVTASAAETRFTLPIELTIGASLPPKLTLKPELPALRGSPNTEFDYKVAIRNDGGDDATVRVDAAAPQGFRVKITEQYGSQELTSFPLKVGETRTVSVKVTPPFGAKQGSYPIAVRAATGRTEARTELAMEVSGAPRLELRGRNDLLSAAAEAGEETPIELVLANRGSAPAHAIKLDATTPSGWKVTFQPERLDTLAPEATETVKALVVPADKAIAGDYMLTLRAVTEGTNESSDFRITVRTSTLWGVVGVLVIAAALVVLVAAMLRYGRR
ncbi:MAG: hypothetical protein KJ025_17830 [Burkholderiales bacterium]|nr:hypothetical protein [Burkholderiales bacterium]